MKLSRYPVYVLGLLALGNVADAIARQAIRPVFYALLCGLSSYMLNEAYTVLERQHRFIQHQQRINNHLMGSIDIMMRGGQPREIPFDWAEEGVFEDDEDLHTRFDSIVQNNFHPEP